MKKKLFKILIFAVITLLAGCSKKPPQYLFVQGYTLPDKQLIRGVATQNENNIVDLKLHSSVYNLDYGGIFADCSVDDPITGSNTVSFAQDRCPTPPKESMLIVEHIDEGDFGESHAYAIYTEVQGSRQIKTAFRIYPDIN